MPLKYKTSKYHKTNKILVKFCVFEILWRNLKVNFTFFLIAMYYICQSISGYY
jgi:hypothetical protein